MKAFWCARTGVASALLLVGLAGGIVASQRTASSMTTAANKFLEGLTPEQRQQAVLPLDSEDLTRWHYVPTNQFPRKGLPIKEMTEAQRKLAHDLLRTGLSQQGYTTATAIMDLETVLRAIESAAKPGAGMNRDPELYFFTVFGTPSAKGPWGWRVEGHHLSRPFHGRRTPRGRELADVLRDQPGRSAGGTEERPAHSGGRAGCRPRAGQRAGRGAAQDGDHRRRRPERHPDDNRRESRSAVANGHDGFRHDGRSRKIS